MVNAMYDIAQIWLNMGKCGIQTTLTQYLRLCKCVNLSSGNNADSSHILTEVSTPAFVTLTGSLRLHEPV